MHIKCGEIFIHDQDYFTFLCTNCKTSFQNVEDFIHHIKIDCLNMNNVGDDDDVEVSQFTEETFSILKNLVIESCDEESDELEKENSLNKNYIETVKQLYENYKLNSNDNEENIEYVNTEDDDNNQVDKDEIESKSMKQNNESNEFFDFRKLIKHKNKIKVPENCRHCNREFSCRRARREHERVHTGEKPYQCEICGNRFRTNCSLSLHKTSHSNLRLFQCDKCGASFKNHAKLFNHKYRHGEKKHKCSICEKAFFTKSERRIHERTHNRETYTCPTCNLRFRFKKNLAVHRRNHKNESSSLTVNQDERPFACTICNAKFKRKNNLTGHERIHSELYRFFCKICNNGFKEQIGLKLHMRKHDDTANRKRKNKKVYADDEKYN